MYHRDGPLGALVISFALAAPAVVTADAQKGYWTWRHAQPNDGHGGK